MPIYTNWDNDQKTITRVTFEHTFTLNEVFDAWHEEIALMNSVNHPVYSLNVFTDMKMLLGGLSITKILNFIKQHQPANLRMTIQVTNNPTIRGVLASISKVMSHEVYIVRSLDEAYRIIERDQSLRQVS